MLNVILWNKRYCPAFCVNKPYGEFSLLIMFLLIIIPDGLKI